ncbi:MAG: DUF1992 domain-containing protein [Candidatus Tectimicrobiota bacterium]|nr:MAG: DUF1992 domain-containing protein [Candidatus Tectomicrobia bacterium]
MDIFAKIAEQKIREAMERGEFDNLPFHGIPVIPEDLSSVPEDLRMAYRLLKNAGVLPEELQLRKEILTLQDLLNACYDEETRQELQVELNDKILRYNIMMERRVRGAAHRQYHAKILRKLRGRRPL